jgi:hypothetical protein
VAGGRAAAGGAGRSVLGTGRGTTRGSVLLGSGAVGVVGRCSSIRSRSVGGTTRPGVTTFGAGAGGVAVSSGSGCSMTAGAGRGGVSTRACGTGDSTTAAGVASTIGSSGAGSSRASGSSTGGASTVGTATGFSVLTRRGGGSTGAAGFAGSAAFFGGVPFLPLGTGVSAKMSPLGSEIFRRRARRSTN